MSGKVKDLLKTRIIDPIKRQCPDMVPMDAYLQLIFNIHRRGVSRYRAIEDLDINGLYCVNGCIPTQGIDTQRFVGRLRYIWVRHDDDMDLFHVENAGHVFQLTSEEWSELRPKLVVAGKNVEV